MPTANPYGNLRALLDATRQLQPEEMAELQLEQGFIESALRIYEELLAAEPANERYRTRCAWLARMTAQRSAARRVRRVTPGTLRGVAPIDRNPVRRLPIVRVR